MHPPTLRQSIAMFVVIAALVIGIGGALWHRQDLIVREIHRADHGAQSQPSSYEAEFTRLDGQIRAVMDKLGVTTTTFPTSGDAGQLSPPIGKTTPTTAP
jgi:hypothetical protein